MAKKNGGNLLLLVAAGIAIYLLTKPKKRKPVIEVAPLDKGDFVQDSTDTMKKPILPPARGAEQVEVEAIDFLKPYRATLAGCTTC